MWKWVSTGPVVGTLPKARSLRAAARDKAYARIQAAQWNQSTALENTCQTALAQAQSQFNSAQFAAASGVLTALAQTVDLPWADFQAQLAAADAVFANASTAAELAEALADANQALAQAQAGENDVPEPNVPQVGDLSAYRGPYSVAVDYQGYTVGLPGVMTGSWAGYDDIALEEYVVGVDWVENATQWHYMPDFEVFFLASDGFSYFCYWTEPYWGYSSSGQARCIEPWFNGTYPVPVDGGPIDDGLFRSEAGAADLFQFAGADLPWPDATSLAASAPLFGVSGTATGTAWLGSAVEDYEELYPDDYDDSYDVAEEATRAAALSTQGDEEIELQSQASVEVEVAQSGKSHIGELFDGRRIRCVYRQRDDGTWIKELSQLPTNPLPGCQPVALKYIFADPYAAENFSARQLRALEIAAYVVDKETMISVLNKESANLEYDLKYNRGGYDPEFFDPTFSASLERRIRQIDEHIRLLQANIAALKAIFEAEGLGDVELQRHFTGVGTETNAQGNYGGTGWNGAYNLASQYADSRGTDLGVGGVFSVFVEDALTADVAVRLSWNVGRALAGVAISTLNSSGRALSNKAITAEILAGMPQGTNADIVRRSSKIVVKMGGDDAGTIAARKAAEDLAPSSGGRGLFGWVKAGGTVDATLREAYIEIAKSPAFAKCIERYNKVARFLRLKPAATIDEVVESLGKDVTFSKIGNFKAGCFVPGEHSANTTYWIQGNPITGYGQRAGRHELLHLGAALNGQGDTVIHDVVVQFVTTPENLLIIPGFLVVLGGEAYWIYSK